MAVYIYIFIVGVLLGKDLWFCFCASNLPSFACAALFVTSATAPRLQHNHILFSACMHMHHHVDS